MLQRTHALVAKLKISSVPTCAAIATARATAAILAFALTLATSLRSQALEFETVITEDSFSTSSRTLITEEEIRNSRAPNLTSLLQAQANLTISNTNVQPGSIFLRGGDSSHVLILVDGVPYYDGTTTQRTVDLNTLDLRSIRRIEILKGSQSVIYGGQALVGVIRIDTFPVLLQSQTAVTAAAGTQNYQQTSISRMQKLSDNSALYLRGSYLGKINVSPVPESDFKYPSRNRNLDLSYLRRGSQFDSIFKVFMNEKVDELSGNDPSGVYLGATDTKDFRTTNLMRGGSMIFRRTAGVWRPQVSLGFQNSDRAYDQPINAYSPYATADRYGGDVWNLRTDLRYRPGTGLRFDTGLQYTRETFVYRSSGVEQMNTSQELRGLYGKFELPVSDFLSLEAGGRVDDGGQSNAQNLTSTTQLGFVLLEHSRFEYATGFKTASLFQLYGGTYGNPGLRPEKSETYSYTQEFPINDQHFFSFTFFQTSFKDLIRAAGFPTRYENVAQARSQGFETEYHGQIAAGLNLKIAYGYQEPRDLAANNWLLKRPLQSGSVKLSQDFGRNNFNVEAIANGARRDQATRVNPPGVPTYSTLGGYLIWNAAYSWGFSNGASLFARLNNAFDYRYEDAVGYFNEGRSVQVGFEWLH